MTASRCYKQYLFPVLASLALTLVATAASAKGCVDPAIPAGESKQTLRLKADMPSPYFYYRSAESTYVVMVSPESVIAALEARPAQGPDRRGEKLEEALKQDLPLTRDTDLFRYVLAERRYWSDIRLVLADLLASGNAAVLNAEKGSTLWKVDMTRNNYESGRGRHFRSPIGELILSVLDCVD